MLEHIAADEEFGRRDVPVAEAIEIFRGPGPGLQGRADRGPRPRRRRRDRLALPQRPLRGPLPRPARPLDRADQGDQAELGRRRLLARRREPREPDPDLRHRLLLEEGPRAAPGADRARPKARDHRRLGPQLGLFMLRDEAPGMPFWLPNGTTLLRLIEDRGPRAAAQARLPGDRHAAGARRGALAPLRALGQLQATRCTSWRTTTAATRCGR